MTLRRRTSNLLASLFLACFVAALVGAIYTVWKDAALAAFLATCAFIGGAALATFFGEGALTGAVLGAILTVLALGAAALALAGLPFVVTFTSGAFAVALLLLILARSLLAAGSADYPYDS
jgi:hypothetical protein